MKVKTIQFKCDESLHMKSIAILIKKASVFESRIWLTQGSRKANAKSLLGVMSLGIEDGATIEVSAEGSDEAEAVDTIAAYLSNPTVE
ncbi:MAG: HPr family phosphocarrier protein [Fastidiosipilaceae bacterium]|jgi:phosphotransferase system HPr (HPr) family protein|nr:HPr family phosphocarrier protein [Clostridiaceae bacterium]